MLKVLKKIGFGKNEETVEKPDNGDVTAKSFGGMGREKLRNDLLKHKGMGKAPVPTAAGLALKQKQEIEKATAKLISNPSSNTPQYGSDSFGFSGSIGITSSSFNGMSASHIEAVLPQMDELEHETESEKTIKDDIDLPSLSLDASMTFEVDNNADLPSDSEIASLQESDDLTFPGYNDLSLKKNDADILDFKPSGNKSGLSIQKSSERLSNSSNQKSQSTQSTNSQSKTVTPSLSSIELSLPSISLDTSDFDTNSTINKTNILDTNFDLKDKPLSFSKPTGDDLSLDDSPSLTLDIPAQIPSTPSMGQNIQIQQQKNQNKIVVEAATPIYNEELSGKDLEFAQELATVYSEGGIEYVITTLRNHLSQNNGTVAQRFWYMLMDCYQVSQNKEEFEKVAIAFAYLFSTSPPSWFESDDVVKKTVMSGKNIMILEPNFKSIHTEKFKTFLLAAKEEKFCRINVSPCKFELSEYLAIEKLYELFKNLRKNKVLSVLMGDNNLISFCKSYINPNLSNKMLKDDFLAKEQTFWLLYLEILQWKGLETEFEDLALEFAMKFEISPPGWEPSGVMSLDKISKLDVSIEDDEPQLEKALTSNNIESLLNMIKNGFQNSNKAEIELSNVETIDFAAAGSISYQIQELWSDPSHNQKRVIFKYPNEMILTLLEMVGVTEFVDIIYRKR